MKVNTPLDRFDRREKTKMARRVTFYPLIGSYPQGKCPQEHLLRSHSSFKKEKVERLLNSQLLLL